jgi:hypothetical protein
VKEHPRSSPANGATMEKVAHLQSLLLHIFHSPQYRSPLSRFPSQSSHRDTRSISRAFFYLSLKVPNKGAPSPSSPNGATMERDAHFQSLLLHASWSPQYRSPPSRVPSRSLYTERDTPVPKPSLTRLSETPVKEPPLQVPPMERDTCSQSLHLHISQESLVDKLS